MRSPSRLAVGPPPSRSATERRETRALYEAAVSEHGDHAVTIWLAYLRWHAERAEFGEASAVRARALRALAVEHHAPFVEQARAAVAAP